MAAENIFQQYLQPVRSVQDYSNDMDRQEQNALTLAAGRLKAKADQQAMAEDTAIRSAYQQSGGDQNRLVQLLTQGGQYKAAQAAQKAIADAQEQQGNIKHKAAQTAELDAKNLDAALATTRSFANQIDTPQAAAMYLRGMYGHPVLGPVASSLLPMDQAMASIPQDMNSPEGLRWKAAHMNITGKDLIGLLMPKTDSTGLGGNQSFGVTDQFSGVRKETGSAPITQSANNIADNATSRANNAATVGASLANAAATREVAGATRDAANAQRDQATEMKLADDYRAQSKEFAQAKSAHQQLTATLASATTSPAATLAAATKFMKILDPGSVVRESELGMALAASGVLDRAMNYISTLSSGKKLTATQANDFKNISDKMFVAAQQVQQTIDADYKAKAKAYKLRPEMVVQELGQNAGKVVNFSDLK